MPMKVDIRPTELEAVLEVRAGRVDDDRGYFAETWSREMWRQAGFEADFVQDNLSRSRRGTIRGMHWQIAPNAMGKLVRCIQGSVFDVAVDLRDGSAAYGRWVGRELSGENNLSLWIPVGFAHGFLALEDDSLVHYKCTAMHAPESERAMHHADPEVGIEWPIEPSFVTQKDDEAPGIVDVEADF